MAFKTMSKFVALAAVAESTALNGEEVHCHHGRAHLLTYDIEGKPNNGTSLEGIDHAKISLKPSPIHSSYCNSSVASAGGVPHSGNKQTCFGLNVKQDADCDSAVETIPLKYGVECKDCFIAVGADFYYDLDYSWTGLNHVELGLKNMDFRASAALHAHNEGGSEVSGTYHFPGSDKKFTLIDTLVGCPVCVRVNIAIGAPTTMDYKLALNDPRFDVEAGAKLNLHLGNEFVRYESGKGWSHETHKPEVTVIPFLTGVAQLDASLDVAVKTSLQVEMKDIIWYHLNLLPSMSNRLTFHAGINEKLDAEICLDGEPSFAMEQEADLDWKIGWDKLPIYHAQKHWGPSQLYSWSKPGMIHACKKVGGMTTNATSAMLV
jgi:hypothetical protein